MREILFRGKTLTGKWVEGAYYKQKLFYGDKEEADVIITSEENLTYDQALEFAICISETIGQYTGLTDKNGTKIFEGDYWIDTEEGDIFVVEFRNCQFCFVIYGVCGVLMEYGYDETAGGFGECDCVPMDYYVIENIEIVGNIHDNPELLKGGVENGN